MTREQVPITEAPPFELLTVVSLFLVAVFGTIIAYQAYRGYRRNDVTSMLYLSIGLLFLTLGPFLLNVSMTTLTGIAGTTLEFVQNLSRLAGLLTIMYSLYGQH